jgi:hypothetical protein
MKTKTNHIKDTIRTIVLLTFAVSTCLTGVNNLKGSPSETKSEPSTELGKEFQRMGTKVEPFQKSLIYQCEDVTIDGVTTHLIEEIHSNNIVAAMITNILDRSTPNNSDLESPYWSIVLQKDGFKSNIVVRIDSNGNGEVQHGEIKKPVRFKNKDLATYILSNK